MEREIDGARLVLVKGDITEEETDAIVNAANTALAGGSGVDGAIHRAGGPRIMEECRKIGYCPTGEAVMTTGGELRARFVIHTVGPIYKDGHHQEPILLANAYRNSLRVALEKGLASVSFPSISTGAYGYPVKEAAVAAVSAIISFLREHKGISLVRLVLFSQKDLDAYTEALDSIR